MNTLTNTTEMSVAEIAVLLGVDCLNDSPTLANAPTKSRIAPVAFHDGHPILVLDAEQRGGDVYAMLDSVTPDDSVNYYALVTAGWASPYDDNDNLRPSQHPERKRVELLVVASRDGSVASVIAMAGQPLIIDEGKAQGALADAVKAIFG